MFRHYLKIVWRNLWKHKSQSLIGIFGLAFGLACFVPALYWLRYETSYDGFYPESENIYRVYSVEKESGKVNEQVPGILERRLREQFSAVEATAGFIVETDTYHTDEMPHIALGTLYADTSFFRVFPQRVIHGDPDQPLSVLHNVALTESTAVRLFGDAGKAIGRQIESMFQSLVGFPPYTVTAVVEDPPADTNVPFETIIFADWFLAGDMSEAGQWDYFNEQFYIRLHPRADATEMGERLRETGGNANVEFRMLPIGDVHHRLNTDLPFTLNFVRLFAAAGTLLLFCALFNFLNLYLDLFRQRLRELRLRTVHGATDERLIAQITFELVGVLLLAMVFAGCFILFSRSLFTHLLNIEMGLSPLMSLFGICALGVIAVVLLAGLIPIWRLSRLASRHLATGKSISRSLMRRVAVSLQLTVSVVFLVATGIVAMQMRFVNQKYLGFDPRRIVQLSGPFTTMFSHSKAITSQLEKMPQIDIFSGTYFEPQHNTAYTNSEVEWPGKPALEQPVFQTIEADNRFAETFGLTMLAGSWWNERDGDRKIVLNQEAVRIMGLTDPVGTMIRMKPNIIDRPMQEYEVAGVVNDFHTLSLRSRVTPTIFRNIRPVDVTIHYLRVAPGRERETIAAITEMLPTIDESLVDLSLTPLDELYDRLNQSEQAGLKLFSVLAVVCLFISLLGIYAVATAAALRRRKEIAVRKVYGAGIGTIVRMFLREYTLLVILAGTVALPVAYIAMSRWLQGYAYRTSIPWWLLAGVVALVVAVVLLTVARQVLKAAGGNPAEVVKSE